MAPRIPAIRPARGDHSAHEIEKPDHERSSDIEQKKQQRFADGNEQQRDDLLRAESQRRAQLRLVAQIRVRDHANRAGLEEQAAGAPDDEEKEEDPDAPRYVLLEQAEELERALAEPQIQVDAGSGWEPYQDQTQPHEQAEVTPVDVEAPVENLAQPHGPDVGINGSLREGTRGKMRT